MMPFSACTVGEDRGAIATSPRTLQRQLAENGTTFQKLRDQVRADLALKYLRQSTLRFARSPRSSASPSRACSPGRFRRWHGCTPREARRRIAQAAPGTTPAWTPMPSASIGPRIRRPCRSSSSAAASSSAPAILRTALERGHEPTVFNRGRAQSAWPGGVQAIVGDRAADLDALPASAFDAVVDTCGYAPADVQKSAEALRDVKDLLLHLEQSRPTPRSSIRRSARSTRSPTSRRSLPPTATSPTTGRRRRPARPRC
jgi:AraC-like DNA-binding protein